MKIMMIIIMVVVNVLELMELLFCWDLVFWCRGLMFGDGVFGNINYKNYWIVVDLVFMFLNLEVNVLSV